MQVTFLAHSGFAVELEHVCLLFDWWKGELPPLPADKPLLIFASHRHEDHFNPAVFSLDDGSRPVRFLLGHDIRLTERNLARWRVPAETAEKCLSLGGNDCTQPLPGIAVETLPSTDEGVAFVVTAEGRTIYHAGDLHWWHWEGEDKTWNRNMEVNFKRYLAPLEGRTLDLAMVPLDPRLEGAADWGLTYFLEHTDPRRVLPMHQWGDFALTGRFLARHPQWADRVVPITAGGQQFTF